MNRASVFLRQRLVLQFLAAVAAGDDADAHSARGAGIQRHSYLFRSRVLGLSGWTPASVASRPRLGQIARVSAVTLRRRHGRGEPDPHAFVTHGRPSRLGRSWFSRFASEPRVGTNSRQESDLIKPSADSRFALPVHGADDPSTGGQGTTPGSFALAPDVGGPLTYSSPDTPGMPAPSSLTAWDFNPAPRGA